MNQMSASEILNELFGRYPELKICEKDIASAFEVLKNGFKKGGKLLLCGNGGSASDCEHIAGELMKGFLLKRKMKEDLKAEFLKSGDDGEYLSERLQGALPCISLTGSPALSTAFMNDVEPKLVFAQQTYAYAKNGDVLLAISTSGNAENVGFAVKTAKVLGVKTIGLTGESGGKLAELCDICVKVPETETFKIQEYHLPVYHALCAMLEAEFFGD